MRALCAARHAGEYFTAFPWGDDGFYDYHGECGGGEKRPSD